MSGDTDASSAPVRLVVLSGTLHNPSKTGLLIDAIVAQVTTHAEVETHVIDVLDHGHQLIDAIGGAVDDALAADLARVASADLLVVATPVYKGSYTGLLKLFVDFLGQDALLGLPVVLAATGGNDLHSLVIDHELRPLFGFFRAHTLPVGVYARGFDFADGVSESLSASIEAAVDAALPVVRSRQGQLTRI